MCENLDHGTEPKRITVDRRYNQKIAFVHAPPAGRSQDQTSASVVFASSERMNRSARVMRKGGLPSAATSTLRKNQNQYPPTQTIRAPTCQRTGKRAGVGISDVGYQNTMTIVVMA